MGKTFFGDDEIIREDTHEAIHKADVGEPWHPEYGRQRVLGRLQDIETRIAEDVWEWFGELLSGLEEPKRPVGLVSMAKAEPPLPGFVMGRLNDETWWMMFNAILAEKLKQRLLDAARLGAASAGRQVGISLDWQMLLPQVLDWAREYAGALVTQVSDNVRADIRQAVVDGLQAGASWRDIRQKIEETGLPKWRAERIARTEVVRAHAKGAEAGYEASGTVRGVRWLDGQAGACSLCRQLHNQVRRLDQPFYVDRFGDGLPPRHPHCRCAVAPVTLDEVKRLPEDHPLRDNRRASVAELTDRETWTEISGVRITGERKRHWRYKHPDITGVNEQEVFPRIVVKPTHAHLDRDDESVTVHYFRDEHNRWWKAPIATGKNGERFVMTLTRDKVSKKKQREWGIG